MEAALPYPVRLIAVKRCDMETRSHTDGSHQPRILKDIHKLISEAKAAMAFLSGLTIHADTAGQLAERLRVAVDRVERQIAEEEDRL